VRRVRAGVEVLDEGEQRSLADLAAAVLRELLTLTAKATTSRDHTGA
jgi:hypothetical protein